MVIKHAEEKYHDIHANYRDMATQLHDSWMNKYSKLEKENNRLMNALTSLVKQTKSKQSSFDSINLSIERDSSNENESENETVSEHDITSPISHIPIENIAESLDLDDNQLNQLTGGNIGNMINYSPIQSPTNNDNNEQKSNDNDNNDNNDNKENNDDNNKTKTNGNDKKSYKRKRRKRVIETYID